MQKLEYYIVNALTVYRVLAAPVLLFLLLTGYLGIFRWLLALSFFTDAIDGFLARKFKVAGALGSTLDSIGDDLTVGVAVTGIAVLQPEFIRDHLMAVSLLLGLFVVQVIFALVRYRRISSFHSYLAKTAAFFQAIFLLVFYFYGPSIGLFYAAVIVTAADLIEEIIMVIMLPEWEHNVKGLYWIIKSRNR